MAFGDCGSFLCCFCLKIWGENLVTVISSFFFSIYEIISERKLKTINVEL